MFRLAVAINQRVEHPFVATSNSSNAHSLKPPLVVCCTLSQANHFLAGTNPLNIESSLAAMRKSSLLLACGFHLCNSVFAFHCHQSSTRVPTVLCSIIKKNLSAAERERFEEDERRRKRKDDVVIGKTSAIKGAKDFPLDIKSTEEEYLRHANRVEQEVYKWTTTGMECLNSVRPYIFLRVHESLSPNTVFRSSSWKRLTRRFRKYSD